MGRLPYIYLFLKRKWFRIILINLFELAMQSHSNSAFETRIIKVFFNSSLAIARLLVLYSDTFRDSVSILDSAVLPYNTMYCIRILLAIAGLLVLYNTIR